MKNPYAKAKKQAEAISLHFSELGKKSWEARKAKILDKTPIPKRNVKKGLQTNER